MSGVYVVRSDIERVISSNPDINAYRGNTALLQTFLKRAARVRLTGYNISMLCKLDIQAGVVSFVLIPIVLDDFRGVQ